VCKKILKTAALLWFLAVSVSIGLIAFLDAPAIVVALAILLASGSQYEGGKYA
jgi:hypothetical protein